MVETVGEKVLEEIFGVCQYITVELFVGLYTHPCEDLSKLESKTTARPDFPLPCALRNFG